MARKKAELVERLLRDQAAAREVIRAARRGEDQTTVQLNGDRVVVRNVTPKPQYG